MTSCLVTEHPATFTLGRRGGQQNLMVSGQFLQENNIPLVHIERGGDITYHGPGQLVIYPIMHLRQAGLTVSDYVLLSRRNHDPSGGRKRGGGNKRSKESRGLGW